MRRLLLIPVVLLLLLAGAFAWSSGERESRADFAFVNRGDNKSLDPNTMAWMQDIRIAYGLWEGLYALDPQTLKPIPGSADKITFSPDRRTWTFHIRATARWSNGDPLRAQDFLFEWRRMLETPGEYSGLHHYILGAQKYQNDYAAYVAAVDAGKPAKKPEFSMVGEKAIDDHTFVVTLIHPVPFFPALMAFPVFFPMNQRSMRPFAVVDPKSGRTTYNQKFTRPPNLVTNGPFRLAQWSFKLRLRMVANKYYWDRTHVKSRVIDEIYAEEPLAAYRLYEQGDVDWVADVDPELASAMLRKGGRSDLHIFPAFGTYFYALNTNPKLPDGTPNPLAEVRVRQALAMSIDKTLIVRDVGRMGQPITNDYIPPGAFPGYHSPPGLGYNPVRARKLLTEAGYPNGKGFPRISILFNNESIHGDVATMVHRQWQKNLNINVDMEGVEVKTFASREHKHQFTVARSSWYGDYYDPSTFTDKFLSSSEDNNPDWKSKIYDRWCAAAAIEPNHQKRLEDFSKAENVLLNSAPIIPLFTPVDAYLFRSNVKGIPLLPQGMVMFKGIFVKNVARASRT